MSVPVSHTINNWCPQLTGSESLGGWVCSSVWGQHCGKLPRKDAKFYISQAKPGNPASILYINDIVKVSTVLNPILFADDTSLFHAHTDFYTLIETSEEFLIRGIRKSCILSHGLLHIEK